MPKDLYHIKNKTIDRILVLSATLFLPVYVLAMARFFTTGWENIYLLHTIIYIGVVLLAVFRKQIAAYLKMVIVAVTYMALALIGLVKLGFGGAYFYAIIAIAVVSLLNNRKQSLLLTIIFISAYVLIGAGFVLGVLTPIISLDLLIRMPTHWATHVLSILAITLVFIFGFGDIYRELLYSIMRQKTAKTQYRQLFQKANDGITLLKDGIFFDCNEKACELFGMTKEELIGCSVKQVSPSKQRNGLDSEVAAQQLIEQTLSGEPQRFEWQHIQANGNLFDVAISLNKVEVGDTFYTQAIMRDITQEKKQKAELDRYKNHLEQEVARKTRELEDALAEIKATNEEISATNEELYVKNEVIKTKNETLEQAFSDLKATQLKLAQADKMASLGVLTAGVAHEINNPLNFIMSAHYGLENYFHQHGSHDHQHTNLLLSSLKSGVDRASDIVKSLGEFSREGGKMETISNLNEIIDRSLTVVENTSKAITITKEYAQEEARITGNAKRLLQAFSTIMQNAIDAIDHEGKISIITARQHGNIAITVKDTGCGISEENLPQITAPFFTTKEPGQGVGLGLSIAYSIIKEHGGELEFSSKPQQGTTVTVLLPLQV